jgi:glycosyltransferase involved in cell wall biosynthesis
MKGAVRKILFFITEDWYFWSHRLPLAKAAKNAGYDVSIVTRASTLSERILAEGFRLIPVDIERRSGNPIKELRTLLSLLKIYLNVRPDIAHHVGLKPILYGSLVARLAGVRATVNALAGLGYIFSSRETKARLLRPFVIAAYRLMLRSRITRTIVQNPDDQKMLISEGIVDTERTALIRGSGVDTEYFSVLPEPAGTPVVLLAARMLYDKGVGEFVDAARLLKARNVKARFVLVGDRDPENPTAIPEDVLSTWRRDGVVEWWGHQSDMRSVFAQAHIVCLPSYREGLPKILLEAAACGRAIVTSDVPGCREIVRDHVNGLLVPARQSEPLASALEELVGNPGLRQKYGASGRELVEQEFRVQKIVDQTLDVYRDLAK